MQSEILKRVMHPFTYKPPRTNFKVNGLDTGMTPKEFGRYLRVALIRHGLNPTHYTAATAASWWYAQQFDPEDELG